MWYVRTPYYLTCSCGWRKDDSLRKLSFSIAVSMKYFTREVLGVVLLFVSCSTCNTQQQLKTLREIPQVKAMLISPAAWMLLSVLCVALCVRAYGDLLQKRGVSHVTIVDGFMTCNHLLATTCV